MDTPLIIPPPIHKSLSERRSEEVAPLIEHMPSKLGLSVIAIIIGLVILLLGFGWIISYPDVLKGEITINHLQAPIKMVANTSGRLQLYKDTGQQIRKEEYIAVIKNPAQTGDVIVLDSLINTIDIHHVDYATHRHFFPENISIGELSQDYFSFLNALYQYFDYYHEGSYEKQRNILEKQAASLQKIAENLNKNIESEGEKYQLNQGFYRRDSTIFKSRIISAQEFEQRRIVLANSRQQYQQLENEIINNRYQRQDVQNKLEQLKVQRVDKENALAIGMYNHYYQLEKALSNWKRQYAFIAPTNGKLEFLNFWKEDEFITTGKEVFSLIPSDNAITGQVKLPAAGAGKVAIGQEVIIKLDDYPYTQFGSIKGKVTHMSVITNEQTNAYNQKVNNYLVTVTLPKGLESNYGKALQIKYEAKGTAEIITQKRKLIERLFDNLKHSTR